MRIVIKIITDTSQLCGIEKELDDFIGKWSNSPFLSSSFIKEGAKLCRSDGWIPLILIIYHSNRIIGMAPLALQNKFGINMARFLFGGHFLPDIVANDDYREICIFTVLKTLLNYLKCKFVNLTLSTDSENLTLVKKYSRELSVFFSKKTTGSRRIIHVNGTWDSFLEGKSRSFARSIRKSLRKLDKSGIWNINCVKNVSQDPKVFEKIAEIAKRSWKKKWMADRGIKADPELSAILNVLRDAVNENPVFQWQVYFLKLNNHLLAYRLIFIKEGKIFCKRTSYDERYSGFAPGKVLQYFVFKRLFNESNIKLIDFCNDHPYMEDWSPNVIPQITVYIQKNFFIAIIAKILTSKLFRKLSKTRLSG